MRDALASVRRAVALCRLINRRHGLFALIRRHVVVGLSFRIGVHVKLFPDYTY
jgi:hypothetical protein